MMIEGGRAHMNFRDAAITVLREEGKPLHYENIARLAEERGYITSAGKTPADSLSTELSRDMRNHGERSPFIKVGRGIYALKEMQTGTGSEGPAQSEDVNRTVL
jgi:hypothetical protein